MSLPTPDDYDLDVMDIAVLKVAADACQYTESKHVPLGAITKRFPPNLQRDGKKRLKKLCAKNLLYKQPTGGNLTYYLSKEGKRIAQMA